MTAWRTPIDLGRTLGAGLGAGRLLFGAAYLARPGLAAPTWIGRPALEPAVQVVIRAQAARDAALGLGAMDRVLRDLDPSPWLVAFAVADTVDAVTTWSVRRSLPVNAVAPAIGVAVGSVALSVTAAVLVRRRRSG